MIFMPSTHTYVLKEAGAAVTRHPQFLCNTIRNDVRSSSPLRAVRHAARRIPIDKARFNAGSLGCTADERI